uniref:Putative ovule protein n=1 Tax=Solanum chacoense TaxID=4108 RepID=A0A0V0GWX2_SOLCH
MLTNTLGVRSLLIFLLLCYVVLLLALGCNEYNDSSGCWFSLHMLLVNLQLSLSLSYYPLLCSSLL